eukprot:2795890-Alexandrium_andersonii.AAC.1
MTAPHPARAADASTPPDPSVAIHRPSGGGLAGPARTGPHSRRAKGPPSCASRRAAHSRRLSGSRLEKNRRRRLRCCEHNVTRSGSRTPCVTS